MLRVVVNGSGITTCMQEYAGHRVALRRDGALHYLHTDHLGSASLATDASGGVVSEMRYTPYGVTRSGDMSTAQRFTDQRWEGSTHIVVNSVAKALTPQPPSGWSLVVGRPNTN